MPSSERAPGGLRGFGDSALVFRLYVWVDLATQPDRGAVIADVRHCIAERFAEAGFAIAFPQTDVHLDKQPADARPGLAGGQSGRQDRIIETLPKRTDANPSSLERTTMKTAIAAIALFLLAHSAQAASAAFEATEALHGVSFAVSSPNTATANKVAIVPSGLAIDNSPVEVETSGVVTGAEVADIDADGSPEIYVYVSGPAPDTRGSLIAYSANKKKSLSQIFVPALEDDPKNAKGYRGHDEFTVLEGVIGRRFPIYPDDTSETEPTGKMRQIQYRLVPGEASWVLKVDRVVELR